MSDLSDLCVHTITTKPWSIEESLEQYSKRGIGGISIWQNAVESRNLNHIRERINQYPLEVVSYVRGGFFAHSSKRQREKAIVQNKRMIEEAAILTAPLLVLVCGAEPNQSLAMSRDQILRGIEKILPLAENLNVRLGIEPLHPMYADTRSAINTIHQANQMVEYFNSDYLGTVIDVYHVWWENDLETEIKRCGSRGRIFAFHICDWKVPTIDLLNDREIPGKGCIPLDQITTWINDSGFDGYREVEIFSNFYWEQNQEDFLDEIVRSYRLLVDGFVG